jgi:hypothetical protein
MTAQQGVKVTVEVIVLPFSLYVSSGCSSNVDYFHTDQGVVTKNGFNSKHYQNRRRI